MRRLISRFWLLLATMSLLVVTTGCFQAASGEPDSPPPAAVGQASSPTPEIPTDIPSETPEPTTDDAGLFPATNTPPPVPPASATPTATLAIAAVGTPTPPSDDLQGLPPEQAIDPNSTPAAPVVETLSPARQTATAIINADATANAELTLGSPGNATNVFPIPTSTPFGTPQDGGGLLPTATPGGGVIATTVPGGVPGQCIHTVAPGDNLFRISLRYDVPIETIAAANPTKISTINIIVVGDQLVIPNCTGGTTTQPPTTGTCNPNVPGSYRFTHVVRQYETLFSISMQYNSPVASIAACSNIPNINLIYINQTLYIP